MKKLLLLVFFFSVLNAFSQQIKPHKETCADYISILKLNEKQSEQFDKIYFTYKEKLIKSSRDNSEFNKNNKLRDLEIYEILTPEQFKKYKEIKLKLEPNNVYRF